MTNEAHTRIDSSSIKVNKKGWSSFIRNTVFCVYLTFKEAVKLFIIIKIKKISNTTGI